MTGTGLGLAVVRELVTACGGRCAIESGRERGARVVVDLPTASAGHAMSRVLVIEDNRDLAFGLRNNLEIEGHEVEVGARRTRGLGRRAACVALTSWSSI